MKITDLNGTVRLNNGVEMPYMGLGVFKSNEGNEVINAVTYALNAGYRHIDTAAVYQNEKGVGIAVNNHPAGRKNVFITSKVWNSDQGYDSTIRAFDRSLDLLNTNYLDLYLVHWPVKGKYKETYRALETLYNEGRVKAIGVSNFLVHHLDDLLQSAKIVPMVNQFEFHPYLVQPDLLAMCFNNGIQPEAWSPLMQGRIFNVKEMHALANKYNKTIAQITLRWDIQKGVITIPKSINQQRIILNADIFDFELSDEDMLLIDHLDMHTRVGADPDNFNF
ncbi:MAG: aldo/keto reductase [Cytophagaceae bacterium]|jgi:diketogulonate reductase-like aldo/keto reductase|nr:aldo/keto reductase [Cytophagaceae bacterium]